MATANKIKSIEEVCMYYFSTQLWTFIMKPFDGKIDKIKKVNIYIYLIKSYCCFFLSELLQYSFENCIIEDERRQKKDKLKLNF